jgi:hypothetical protein
MPWQNVHGGTGGNYEVAEDLSGSSYLSSASKLITNQEEASQHANTFRELMKPTGMQLSSSEEVAGDDEPDQRSKVPKSESAEDVEQREREEAQRIINLTRQIQRTFQTCSVAAPR